MLNDVHGAELRGTLERKLRHDACELRIVDDFGVLAMDPAQAKLTFLGGIGGHVFPGARFGPILEVRETDRGGGSRRLGR